MLTEEEQRELREDFEESAAYVHAYFRAYFLGKLDDERLRREIAN